MLQQTQVERVIPKFEAFIQQFPSIKSLSQAKLSDVLRAWQGLGYNRRAKFIWQAAQAIIDQGGEFPKTVAELEKLPGIGPYTASAIACFSYNQPVVLIETNVRTIFLYHFFPQQHQVSDKELLPLIKETVDTSNPREWYWALMDYGSYLKKSVPNPSRQSKQYTKQSSFAGSQRQARGEILRMLAAAPELDIKNMEVRMTSNPKHFESAISALVSEGFIREHEGKYRLVED